MTACRVRSTLGLILLAAWSIGAAGCTTTRTVDPDASGALAQLNAALADETVEVAHAHGREEATRLWLSPDSTRWLHGEARRAVPTDSVFSIVVNPRAGNVRRWAAAGAVVFGLLSAQLCNEADEREVDCYLGTGLVGAFIGGLVFSLYAALGTEAVEYVLLE